MKAAASGRQSTTGPLVRSAARFLLIGLVLRLQFLGNPLQHIDEQFYLLVADRMGQGALPYVDIWDRKPLGLFLLYRLAFLLPGNPVTAIQLLGLASAAATALVIERMARMIARPSAARLSGAAYMAFMPVFGNGYAQTPVFYNLIVATCALLTVRAALRERDRRLWQDGALVMALLGLAIQIKYTVVFEGIGLGLILLWRAWADRIGGLRVIGQTALWIALALLPTLAAWGWYAAMGHGQDFVFANFLSIFAKTKGANRDLLRVFHVTLILSPLLVGLLLGPPTERNTRAHVLLRCWMLAAFLGFVLFGRWYDHYVGPLLAPLALLAAPLLDRARWYRRLVIFVAVVTNIVVFVDHYLDDGRTAEAQAGAARIAADLHGGCLYAYQGPTVFYRLTGACTATRFIFPDHLATYPEAKAIGVDPVAEVRRIMASRPAVVLADRGAHPYMPNLQTRAVLDRALAKEYAYRGEITLGNQRIGMWSLRR